MRHGRGDRPGHRRVTGQTILSRKGIQAHIDDPGVLRSVLGAGLYVAVLGLLALGLSTLIRRTAGAIATVVGLTAALVLNRCVT